MALGLQENTPRHKGHTRAPTPLSSSAPPGPRLKIPPPVSKDRRTLNSSAPPGPRPRIPPLLSKEHRALNSSVPPEPRLPIPQPLSKRRRAINSSARLHRLRTSRAASLPKVLRAALTGLADTPPP